MMNLDKIFETSEEAINDFTNYDVNTKVVSSFLKQLIFVTLHRPSPHASISFKSPSNNQVIFLSYDQVYNHISCMIQIEIELHHWQTQKDGLWRVSTDNPSDLPIFVAGDEDGVRV